jgi:HEAT repeat protein
MHGRAHKWRWLAAVGAALLLVVVLWQIRMRTGTWTVVQGEHRSAVPPVEKPAERTGTRGRPDSAGRYALDYQLTYEAPAVQGGRATAELHWQTEWQVAPLPGMPGWLGVRTLPGQWQANAALRAVTGLQDADRPRLETPFAVRVAPDGQLAELRFAEGTPAPVAALLGAVAHASQFVRPAQAEGTAWQAQEQDLTGTFVAQYQMQAPGRVTKRWNGSGAQAGQADPLGLHQDTSAEFTLQDGHVQTVTWTQQGRMQPPVDSEVAGTTFRIAVRLERRGQATTAWLAGLDPRTLQPFDADVAVDREHAPQPVAWENLHSDLTALGAATTAEQRGQVRDRVLVAMQHQPEIVTQVEAALVDGKLTEPAERTLLEALVGAGTPGAQQAVARLITDDKLVESLRDRALMAATMLHAAEEAFVARLLAADLDQPARRSATAVTLGAVARDLTPGQPVRAGQLAAALVAEAKAALDPKAAMPSLMDQCNWLAALGNTGDPQALPAILQALADPKEDVRIAAAHALRFQDPAATADAMTLQMAGDASLDVRTALLHAARWQGAKARLAFVEKALRFDRSEAVRLEAAFTLASWSVTAPGIRKALAEALAVEKSETVQEALRNYLTPGRIAAPFQQQPQGTAP